jgi:para-nitrobenzyl esterase
MITPSDRPAMGLTRREILVRGPMALACTVLARSRALGSGSGATDFVEVETACGRLRGLRSDGLVTFKGIPYAGPVAGAGRFKAAPPSPAWTGVRDALQLGAPCCQPGRTSPRGNEPAPDENCLFLNVWTPAADGRRRPVMFYSHGGGFTIGSGGAPYQDGGNLARTFDVVVVATNHRLGLLGFLYLGELGGEEYASSGNQGLLDIRDGLRWVHDNIEAFGGDPDNVMIFGESGGGAKTSCLYAMPSAAPYFNKASIESGPGIRMFPRDVAAETTLMALEELGLARSEWRKLLEVPADELLAVQDTLGRPPAGPLTMTGGSRGMASGTRPGGFGPVVDGVVLPRHPFEPDAPRISKDKPLIVGSNRDETVFFFREQGNTGVFDLTEDALKERLSSELGADAKVVLDTYRESRPNASPTDLYIAITTARMFGLGAITIAERKQAQHGAPVFMYVFVHESEALVPGTQHKAGAPHAMEIPYKFYLLRAGEPRGGGGGGTMSISSPEDEETAHNMAEMWSTFARTGRPAAEGQPEWPPYTTPQRATMEIDAQCRVVDDPHPLERRLWERLGA